MKRTALYPRPLERRLIEALENSPVVLIHGPRQCGKTTLAQMVCAPRELKDKTLLAGRTATEIPEYEYLILDDDVICETAKTDPAGFFT